jgi:hypothetical protein
VAAPEPPSAEWDAQPPPGPPRPLAVGLALGAAASAMERP